MTDFRRQLSFHRPELLRHCYRMLGSFADAEDLVQDTLLRAWNARDTYAGNAPVSHWLMRIATNACLNELASRRRRGLPQLDEVAAVELVHVEEQAGLEWVTPAPDAQLFPEPTQAVETRESVALAFLALLQRLSARQRAVFLLKDVLNWSVTEIASALEMSEAAVSSALHRARETVSSPKAMPAADPSTEALQSYVRSWELHDVDALLTLMRDDIVFSMPPFPTWFRGRTNVERFLRGPQFRARWSAGFRTRLTRANGLIGLAFYRSHEGEYHASSLQVIRFTDNLAAEIVCFIGPECLRGFELPERLTR
ncbi:MAG TPA: RNA polymerase subunit sigma-70 [Polyangiaceae bacterium]